MPPTTEPLIRHATREGPSPPLPISSLPPSLHCSFLLTNPCRRSKNPRPDPRPRRIRKRHFRSARHAFLAARHPVVSPVSVTRLRPYTAGVPSPYRSFFFFVDFCRRRLGRRRLHRPSGLRALLPYLLHLARGPWHLARRPLRERRAQGERVRDEAAAALGAGGEGIAWRRGGGEIGVGGVAVE